MRERTWRIKLLSQHKIQKRVTQYCHIVCVFINVDKKKKNIKWIEKYKKCLIEIYYWFYFHIHCIKHVSYWVNEICLPK